MSSQSNVMSESSLQAQRIAATALPPARLLYWSMRREFWENRYLYIVPVAVASVFLFGFSLGTLHLQVEARAAGRLDPTQQCEMFQQPYQFAENLIMGAALIVGMFYSVEALYGERRERSILFWKSLPVSDLTTVLSKASIPMLVLPLLTFAVTVITQGMMLLLSSVVLIQSGHSAWLLWSRLAVPHMWLMLLFHFVAIHGLWQSPIYGWLLLTSAWARSAPILWASLPPLTLGVVEKVAFNTTHFGTLIGNRFTGGAEGEAIMQQGRSMDPMTPFAPAHFLISPGLWIGLALTAIFLAAAVRLRRFHGPL